MKTKSQKQTELKRADEMLKGSKTLLFTDFRNVSSEDMRKLRREMKGIGAALLVIKKRLLDVLLKQKGIEYDTHALDGAVGTVFSPASAEEVAGSVYQVLASRGGTDKKLKEANIKKMLGGYDLVGKQPIDQKMILMLGQLPPRPVALAQLLGQILAPIQSLMYILNEKAKRSS